jgi:hypothetical protein
MADKPAAEIEFELRREAWNQQVARRDTVRSTLAVPLAVMGFAAVGFNGLAANARPNWDEPVLAVLSVLGLALAAFSVLMFLCAVWKALSFDYKAVVPLPEAQDLDQQEKELVRDLKTLDYGLDEIRSLSRAGVWKALNASYGAAAQKLTALNDDNLRIQGQMLRFILAGLAMLLCSILMFATLHILRGDGAEAAPQEFIESL